MSKVRKGPAPTISVKLEMPMPISRRPRPTSTSRSGLVDEMRGDVEQHVPAAEASLYGTAAPLDQCFLGLVRYCASAG